jgi:NitT/TauT family transport system substrate-binding protein
MGVIMKKNLTLAVLALVLLSACGSKPTPTLTHVKLSLGYIPDIQFSPLYVAAQKGYFADAGIEIEFAYQDETQATALVGANTLQFAVVSGEQVLLARAQGLPVVYVAAWYQQYPVSVVAMADQGISTPADLRGKTIGLPGPYGANYIGLRALLRAGGLKETDVTLDSIGYTQVASLVAGRDQVVSVYTNNEPIQMRAQGYKLTELRVADYVQLASNGLIINETTAAANPSLVRGMVAALLHGLSDTIADPAAAYQVSLGYVPTLAQANATIQKQVLSTSIDLWKAARLGESNQSAWENMQNTLLDMGLLTQPLDLTKAFTNQFLP